LLFRRHHFLSVTLALAHGDEKKAYSAALKLKAQMLPASLHLLSLADTVGDLETALMPYQATISVEAGKTGATEQSVAAAVTAEHAALHGAGLSSISAGGPAASNTTSATFGLSIGRAAAAMKLMPYKHFETAIAALDTSTVDGRRDAISSAFSGDCMLATHVAMYVPRTDREPSSKLSNLSSALTLLASLLPYRYEFFNYVMRVDVATGVVPTNMLRYSFATLTEHTFLDRFLKCEWDTLDWVNGEHGVLAYRRHQYALPKPDDPVPPEDLYIVPANVRSFAEYGAKLFAAIGFPSSPPAGTGLSFGEFCNVYVKHLELGLRMETAAQQMAHVTACDKTFREALVVMKTTVLQQVYGPELDTQHALRGLISADSSILSDMLRRDDREKKRAHDRAEEDDVERKVDGPLG